MEQAEQIADEIAQIYLKSSGYISHETDKIFERFRTKHKLSEAEVYQLLNTLQDKTSIEQLKEALRTSKDSHVKAKILAELESPAYQARLERLKQLQNQIDLTMQQVYKQEKARSTSHYLDLANEAYYRSIFDIQQQTGYGFSFTVIDSKVIDKVINSKWSGTNYSKRIWHNTQALARVLKEELLINLLTGRTDREVAEIIANKYAQGASNARRLVRTESCNLANQMEMESYKECGIETYIFVATLDLKTSEPCRKLNNQRFAVSEQQPGLNCPPMHPWCRSTTICDISDAGLAQMKRRARNPETGKTELVPASMTYEQWYDKYVKGRPEIEAKEQMVKNRSVDKRQHERYQKLLGNDAPESLESFQHMKYNDNEKFEKLKEQFQHEKKVITFKEKLSKGEINTNIKKQKQTEHVQGTKKWKERLLRDLESKGTAPDIFMKDTDIQALLDRYAGTGIIRYRKGQQFPVEYVSADEIIGKCFNLGKGEYENTKRFAIRYSQKGVHLHPVKEV